MPNKSAPTNLQASLWQLIEKTTSELSPDVQALLAAAASNEKPQTNAAYAMEVISENMQLAQQKRQPLCQDTGTILFYVDHPLHFDQSTFITTAQEVVAEATSQGLLRENSVNILTEKNNTRNVGPGHPSFHFQQSVDALTVRLMLKGGGCENVGAQYSLPDTRLQAGRDLLGVKKVVLDAVYQAQGRGCGPGFLGVCVGGDRASSHEHAKYQLLRHLDDVNPIPELAQLEQEILAACQELKIGPMGFGGNSTLLACKLGILNRLPASYFVTISYMCWAFRRQGIILDADLAIARWCY